MENMKDLKKMFTTNKKNIMLMIGTGVISMAAGCVIGMIKEKMKSMDTCCIIDEL